MGVFEKFEKIGFNVKDAVNRLGSEEIFLALIPSFVDDIKLDMKLLKETFNKKKFDECIRILHSLKGVAATLSHDGIKSRSEILEEEMNIKDYGEEIKDKIYEYLVKEMEQYIDYCSEIINNI